VTAALLDNFEGTVLVITTIMQVSAWRLVVTAGIRAIDSGVKRFTSTLIAPDTLCATGLFAQRSSVR
jgi:hypothetical protein